MSEMLQLSEWGTLEIIGFIVSFVIANVLFTLLFDRLVGKR